MPESFDTGAHARSDTPECVSGPVRSQCCSKAECNGHGEDEPVSPPQVAQNNDLDTRHRDVCKEESLQSIAISLQYSQESQALWLEKRKSVMLFALEMNAWV